MHELHVVGDGDEVGVVEALQTRSADERLAGETTLVRDLERIVGESRGGHEAKGGTSRQQGSTDHC